MSRKVFFCHLLLFYPGLSTWPDWHPLIILLAGLRPAWGGESKRGHLALRQGTKSPAPTTVCVDQNKVFFCHLLLFYPGLSTWPDWHPLIILLAGLRPAWGGESNRGHLALRQGTKSPAPTTVCVDQNKVFFCHLLLFYPGLSTWPDWHPLIILLA